jgi:hypothetical protein
MAVNHALDVRTLLVNLQVQQRLTRSFLDTGGLLAGHVNRANIFYFQEAFAVHGRRAQNFVLADSDGDVTIVRGRKSLVVKAASDFNDVLLDLVCVHLGVRLKLR